VNDAVVFPAPLQPAMMYKFFCTLKRVWFWVLYKIF